MVAIVDDSRSFTQHDTLLATRIPMSRVASSTRVSGALRCVLRDDSRSSSRKRDRDELERTGRAHRVVDDDRGGFAAARRSKAG
jgi:hypothetical protein